MSNSKKMNAYATYPSGPRINKLATMVSFRFNIGMIDNSGPGIKKKERIHK
jgi:hypothetical protein